MSVWSVTVESDGHGRPHLVVVTDNDGVAHRFVRSDDASERALKAAQDAARLAEKRIQSEMSLLHTRIANSTKFG